MANGKPISIAHLVLGKLIDSVKGITATLNWVIDFCANFSTKNGSCLELTGANEGKPLLDIKKEKLEEIVEEVIERKMSEIVQSVTEQIGADISISGGSRTNMVVNKDGLHFTIDVLWT